MTNFFGWTYRAVGAGIAIALMELLATVSGEPLTLLPFVMAARRALGARRRDPV